MTPYSGRGFLQSYAPFSPPVRPWFDTNETTTTLNHPAPTRCPSKGVFVVVVVIVAVMVAVAVVLMLCLWYVQCRARVVVLILLVVYAVVMVVSCSCVFSVQSRLALSSKSIVCVSA